MTSPRSRAWTLVGCAALLILLGVCGGRCASSNPPEDRTEVADDAL